MIHIEKWKDIEGYEDYYEISSQGRVRNIKTNKILNPNDLNNMGYKRITLYNPVRKRFFIHRLVAYHFCEGYRDDLVVNHKDGNKQNNNYENLEWVTRSENDLHAYKNNLRHVSGGAIIQQEKAQRRVFLEAIDTGEVVFIFDNYKQCAKYFQLNETYVMQCCRGMYNLKRKYKAYYEKSALKLNDYRKRNI